LLKDAEDKYRTAIQLCRKESWSIRTEGQARYNLALTYLYQAQCLEMAEDIDVNDNNNNNNNNKNTNNKNNNSATKNVKEIRLQLRQEALVAGKDCLEKLVVEGDALGDVHGNVEYLLACFYAMLGQEQQCQYYLRLMYGLPPLAPPKLIVNTKTDDDTADTNDTNDSMIKKLLSCFVLGKKKLSSSDDTTRGVVVEKSHNNNNNNSQLELPQQQSGTGSNSSGSSSDVELLLRKELDSVRNTAWFQQLLTTVQQMKNK
jgi:hypothetical protein